MSENKPVKWNPLMARWADDEFVIIKPKEPKDPKEPTEKKQT